VPHRCCGRPLRNVRAGAPTGSGGAVSL